MQLLHADPSLRPSAAEALQHPWVRGDTPRSLHMDATVRSLREFNARRKFRVSPSLVDTLTLINFPGRWRKMAWLGIQIAVAGCDGFSFW